jgi:methylase of polypeptide subunit release factors
MTLSMEPDEACLARLLHWLRDQGYRFIAPTPATHRRVLARTWSGPTTLRDVFGWSRPFSRGDLAAECLMLMESAGVLEGDGDRCSSRLRVASLGEDLFFHSAFPTDDTDAVFFGPDTYRFARFLQVRLPELARPAGMVDMGAGSGAGGICAARMVPEARLSLVDLNPAASRLARVNAAVAGVEAQTLESGSVPPGADLVIANPPYMIDPAARAYRDGGGLLGGETALQWVRQALSGLKPGGSILLYTGAAVTGGEAPLVTALKAVCAKCGATCSIEEIDPDVFGEELDEPAYAEVERIAVIGAVITLRV